MISSVPTVDQVVDGTALENIIAGASTQPVVAGVAVQMVVILSAIDQVRGLAAVKYIAIVATQERFRGVARIQLRAVVSPRNQPVGLYAAHDLSRVGQTNQASGQASVHTTGRPGPNDHSVGIELAAIGDQQSDAPGVLREGDDPVTRRSRNVSFDKDVVIAVFDLVQRRFQSVFHGGLIGVIVDRIRRLVQVRERERAPNHILAGEDVNCLLLVHGGGPGIGRDLHGSAAGFQTGCRNTTGIHSARVHIHRRHVTGERVVRDSPRVADTALWFAGPRVVHRFDRNIDPQGGTQSVGSVRAVSDRPGNLHIIRVNHDLSLMIGIRTMQSRAVGGQ